jgi:hypothetical protein
LWIDLFGPKKAAVLAQYFGGQPEMYWPAAQMTAQSYGAPLDRLNWWAEARSGMPCPGSKEWKVWKANQAKAAQGQSGTTDETESTETPKPKTKAKRKAKVKEAQASPEATMPPAEATPSPEVESGGEATTVDVSPEAGSPAADVAEPQTSNAGLYSVEGTELVSKAEVQSTVAELIRAAAEAVEAKEGEVGAPVAPSPTESNQNDPDFLEDAIGPNGEIDPLALLELRIKGKRQQLRAEEQMLMEAVKAEADKGNFSDLIRSVVEAALPPSVLGGPQ